MTVSNSTPKILDALVIGAGFTGLYALYRLRERGLKVLTVESGTGIGGTWYWNRYPGARTDSSSTVYQYWFSDELLQEWNWSERFPAQKETERYLNFVADKFALRKDIQFNTRVTRADYDESSARWLVTTQNGERFSAQFLVMGTGGLTKFVMPNIPGVEDFAGESHHTARWPKEPVDFAGKRVGIIGTGATGIQVIQTIADKVDHLTVFQRTPNYTIPMRNLKLDDAARAELRASYPTLKTRVHNTFAGFEYDFGERGFFDTPPAERRRLMEELWQDGSLSFWIAGFREVFSDERANREFSDFVREKIGARINDAAIAAKLLPTDYGFGTRRVPLETNYFEVYNRDNVTLVDTVSEPIVKINAHSVTTAAREVPLDMMIYATGFDAGTGALTAIDIRGRGGVLLKDAWSDGVRTFMGLQVSGYPNMFMVMAPMSPSAAFCNVPTCVQQQVDWITDTVEFVRGQARGAIEPTAEAETKWVAHHNEVAEATLVPKTKSWYMGTNIDGKKQSLLVYAGGANVYRQLCDDVKKRGYEEFTLT
ncbi:MAG: NAD(P)/FAD-dependent oxidoreductase [Proteobacteria bacterium]|nr:NAD(P)/FAD-dependent oxidoreductase [Pseudomonadota bacterium]